MEGNRAEGNDTSLCLFVLTFITTVMFHRSIPLSIYLSIYLSIHMYKINQPEWDGGWGATSKKYEQQ